MIVSTQQPILLHRDKITRNIAKFWDQISRGWQAVWGLHIHHGYYEANSVLTPREAQEKLIHKLVELVCIPQGAKILDVGCGMGGSSVYFAEQYYAEVTGITLSQQQITIAKQYAASKNIHDIQFKIEDALSLASIADNSVDIVWSLESCEQFFDKKLFLKQALRVLKPGGKLMIATWCASHEEFTGNLAKQYRKLCYAFDVPYMPTIAYYKNLLSQNFILQKTLDWSMHVKKSWDIGVSLVNAYSFWQLLKLGGLRGLRFAQQIKLMRDAFSKNRIKYGVFVAVK